MTTGAHTLDPRRWLETALGPWRERVRESKRYARQPPSAIFLEERPQDADLGPDLHAIQSRVPYDRAIIWEVHHRYFERTGSAAWRHGHIPHLLADNPGFSRQCAALVHRASTLRRGASGGGRAPLVILELGAGLGLFAVSFLRAFEEIDHRRGTDLFPEVLYLLTDYSSRNLRDAREAGPVEELIDRGVLRLCHLDATRPAEIEPLDGSPVEPRGLVAILANYLHCCLPLTVVRKRHGQLWEKHFELFERRARDDAATPADTRLPRSELARLVGRVSWERIGENRLGDSSHRAALEAVTAASGSTPVPYAYGSLHSIERSWPLLAEGGMVLISDKGFVDLGPASGGGDHSPTVHGDSFAHPVNFPLLQRFAEDCGFTSRRTPRADSRLHTLLLAKGPDPRLLAEFDALFVHRNANLEAEDLVERARELMRQGHPAKAERLLRDALAIRPGDLVALFDLGVCREVQGDPEGARACWTEGARSDEFGVVDYDFKLGCMAQKAGELEAAIGHFQASLGKVPSGAASYNLGLCHECRGDFLAAEKAYLAALALEPRDDDVRHAAGLCRLIARSQAVRPAPGPSAAPDIDLTLQPTPGEPS